MPVSPRQTDVYRRRVLSGYREATSAHGNCCCGKSEFPASLHLEVILCGVLRFVGDCGEFSWMSREETAKYLGRFPGWLLPEISESTGSSASSRPNLQAAEATSTE